jgi:hypothetical protein
LLIRPAEVYARGYLNRDLYARKWLFSFRREKLLGVTLDVFARGYLNRDLYARKWLFSFWREKLLGVTLDVSWDVRRGV